MPLSKGYCSDAAPPLPRALPVYPPLPPHCCCCWYCSFDMATLTSHCRHNDRIHITIRQTTTFTFTAVKIISHTNKHPVTNIKPDNCSHITEKTQKLNKVPFIYMHYPKIRISTWCKKKKIAICIIKVIRGLRKRL